MKSKKSETSPIQSLSSELEALEKAFQLTLRIYTQRLGADFDHIRHSVESLEKGKKIAKDRIHDVRDMLMLIRNLEIKPSKGRRRDLKRTESLLDDLGRFVSDWEATSPKPRHPELED